uniref:Phosphatidylinositol N-acetylglucosaminyltransferase subunit C-like n=1 Tax=Phallusia mammillata TaxID=59560 RepID=A0A6F9DP99_9ASCI|nr:phosphatidylinositol N-acetylglucosaminyltransferase subunit C-like [Phallusia mammillata]
MNLRNKFRWKRVLYEDQSVPDNYVDDSFLKSRKTSAQTYHFQTLFVSSLAILQQLCVVCCFVLVWFHMREGNLTPMVVLTMCISVTLVCCFVFTMYSNEQKYIRFFIITDGLKTALLLLIYTGLASPILQTLTHTISTDTLYTMTSMMLLGHLIFHDYGSSGILVSQSVSLNMAIFAAVCLSSRFETAFHTFATIMMALQLFGLWPMVRRRIAAKNQVVLPVITFVLFMIIVAVLVHYSVVCAVAFGCIGLLINFIFPFILVKLQPQKDNIYGPWDEAVLSE